MIMTFIKTTSTYFWLKSKIYLKKVAAITKITLLLSYSNTYKLHKHSPKKTCH